MSGPFIRRCRAPLLTVLAALAATCLAPAARAKEPGTAPLVVLVDSSTEMPLARFANFRLAEGEHKDVGEALARALGRKVHFLGLPRKRIAMALEHGDADVLCGYEPAWLPGPYLWSKPFMDQVEVVLTDLEVQQPAAMADLAGHAIGTVAGFRYPELEQLLGEKFLRNDAATVEINLGKLRARRLHHMVSMLSWYDYRQRQAVVKVGVHPPLVVAVHHTRCALSPRSRLPLRELDRALDSLAADGTLTAIAARYR